MPFPSNIDTLNTGQLIAAIGRLTTPELSSVLRFLKNKHDIDISIPSYTPSSGLPPGDVTDATLTNFGRQEWLALLRIGRTFTASVTAPAVAAQASFVQLTQPVSSTVDFLLYQIIISNTNVAAIDIIIDYNAPNGVGAAAIGSNNRLGSGNASIQLTSGSPPPAAGAGVRNVRIASAAIHIVDSSQGFIAEGRSSNASSRNVTVRTAQNNVELPVSFLWAELPAQPPTYL